MANTPMCSEGPDPMGGGAFSLAIKIDCPIRGIPRCILLLNLLLELDGSTQTPERHANGYADANSSALQQIALLTLGAPERERLARSRQLQPAADPARAERTRVDAAHAGNAAFRIGVLGMLRVDRSYRARSRAGAASHAATRLGDRMKRHALELAIRTPETSARTESILIALPLPYRRTNPLSACARGRAATSPRS